MFGAVGQVDYLVELFKDELGESSGVIATGGLAEVVFGRCRSVETWDPLLTLDGLKLIYDRNRGGGGR